MAIVALAVAVALTILVVAVKLTLDRPTPLIGTPAVPGDQCTAVAGNYTGSMDAEQAGNAAIIAGESIRRGLPPRAATIALVAAWQESGLRNLDHGDRDSVGLFQQRPSQGWGSVEQIMDPWYAAGKFYDALVKVKGWQAISVNDAAQAVQRSGYPNAYGQHESAGRAWASNLTGETQAGVRCLANKGVGGGGDELVALLTKVWGKRLTISTDGKTIAISASSSVTAWAVAQLSMAQLAAHGVTSVQVGAKSWTHSHNGLAAWRDAPTPVKAAQVVVTLR